MCLVTVFATVAVLMPTTALAAGSPLESETFANNSTAAGQWYLPAGSGGTNGACLTAGPVSATTSIPNCAGTPDTSGSGALRLTTNAGDAVGAVFYQASLPTTQGLDVSLDTYQFDGTGADGIVFTLAAANPADPTPPATTGPLGGDLGYAANTQGSPGTAGMPYGYLGIALDVYGNFENTPLAGGSGCTNPSPLVANKAYPESVTARGPGNGTVGYCILGTTATTYNQSSGGGSANGTITNVGAGNTLDKQGNTTRTGDMVPVEMAINPSASRDHHDERADGPGDVVDHRVHAARHHDAADAHRCAAHDEQQRGARDLPGVVDQPRDRNPLPAHVRMDSVDRWIERVPRDQSARRNDADRQRAGPGADQVRQRERNRCSPATTPTSSSRRVSHRAAVPRVTCSPSPTLCPQA